MMNILQQNANIMHSGFSEGIAKWLLLVVIHDNDKLIWTSSHTGEYSCSSAWEI